MKKIKTELFRAGMKFTEALYINDSMLLLQPGVPLKQIEIDRLKRWNINEVLTEGTIIEEINADQTNRGRNQSNDMADPAGIEFYVNQLDGIFESVTQGRRVNRDSIDDIAKNLVNAVENDQNRITQLLLVGNESVNRLPDSSVKCAILATVIGKNMKMLSFRLLQLTTGALLHDIGMLRVPPEIRAKKGSLSAEELKMIRKHPGYGYTIVVKKLKYPEDVAALALLHQERWDGIGYPRKLKGEDIPLGARIVAVADAFVAMVNKRNYGDQMIGYKAMKAILGDNGRHFDPQVLKVLLTNIGIYPVGSFVLLNNSSIGKVTQIQSKAPLRPKIRLIIDEHGNKLSDPAMLDLLSQKELFIAKAIDPQAIGGKSSA